MISRIGTVLCLAVLAAACGGRDRTSPAADSTQAADTATAVAPDYRWIGIYSYDAARPTFRMCEHALAFPLRGSDSLIDLLAAKIDFQAPRPILRVTIAAAGDTTRPDPNGPPVFTITGVGETHTPQAGECVPLSPPVAPPLNERLLREAMTAAGVSAGTPRLVAAYLDSDDRPDAVVLLTSGATCTPAGCDLLAFRGTELGYTLLSRTSHVKPPVALREARSDGVRMLVVGVGQGGGFRDRDARLRFRAGRGYPQDAMVEPPGIHDVYALLLIAP